MDEIINYVMNTPGNTNPNILRGMLQNSGSDDFVVINMIMDENFKNVVSVDISREELAAAIEARKRIYITPHREGDSPDTWYIVTCNILNTDTVAAQASIITFYPQKSLEFNILQVGWNKLETSWVAKHSFKHPE